MACRNRRPALPNALASVALVGALAAPAATAMDEQEQRERILFETREMTASLERSGHLYGDAALDAYLQSVVERLFPGNPRHFRVHAYRDVEFNAFAVATGDLYVNIGALLRMRNEAELASVLGHEGGHVTGDHMYRQVRTAKTAGAIGAVLSAGLVASIGIDPGLSAIATYSSMAGFSRSYEREADLSGFQQMTAAGYDPAAGSAIFSRIARELQARQISQGPYFFASHPRLLERAQSFEELAKASASGELRRDEYLQATAMARAVALALMVEHKNGGELVAVLSDGDLADEIDPAGPFALGEGYRLRGNPGDEERALAQYRRSVELHPGFAPAYGALGRYYARKGQNAQAIEYLERFLAMAPDAREAPFARQALTRLKEGSP